MKNRIPAVMRRVAMSALMLFAASAYALPPDEAPDGTEKEERMEMKMKEIHDKLGLTPEQDKKLTEHRKVHREEARKLREELRAKREAMKQEMDKPAFDEAKVRSIHADMKEIQGHMADQRLDGILEVRKILTPEQSQKFRELTREHWKKGAGHGKGGHHRRGNGPK